MLPPPDTQPVRAHKFYPLNDKRALHTADPTAIQILCAPGTETFIKLKRTFDSQNLLAEKSDSNAQTSLSFLPGSAIQDISINHIHKLGAGEGVIDGNRQSREVVYEHLGGHRDYKLLVWNGHRYHFLPFGSVVSGNEITWGVLKAALEALIQYMVKDVVYGWTRCGFEIWDGENLVGYAKTVQVGSQHLPSG
ncbi:MAG: hypothetical protein Q9168_005312 [Polycauliona sp. 1 TL-2023]